MLNFKCAKLTNRRGATSDAKVEKAKEHRPAAGVNADPDAVMPEERALVKKVKQYQAGEAEMPEEGAFVLARPVLNNATKQNVQRQSV